MTYYSTTLKRFRRLHVYTPPGYVLGKGKFPIFYLLHGASDCDDSWTSVGRAGFILDNLIAAKEAKPMVVVMPAGHTSPFLTGGPWPAVDEFSQDFLNDIMPLVEKNYRVYTDRKNRAPAGRTFEEQHRAKLDDAKLKKGLKLFWFATGKEDFLIETSRATVEMFKKHGFTVVYNETEGGHTWIQWRDYLHEFAPQLFQ